MLRARCVATTTPTTGTLLIMSHWAVACLVTLWCCLPCRCCLRTACHVAIRWLHVVPRCGAAHVTAACALPVMLPSGGCVLCCAVVLPASLPLPPPACCLSCRT